MGAGGSISVRDQEGSAKSLSSLRQGSHDYMESLIEKNRHLEKELEKLKLKEIREDVVKEEEETKHDDICSVLSSEEINHFDENGIYGTLSLRMPNINELQESNVIELTRGGVYVKTKYGPIQFGIPPDTIKDSMKLGLSVPKYFVVPHERFQLELGINIAEIEFPAYFNFFILQSHLNLIVTEEQEEALRIAFHETLEGPKKEDLFEDEEYGQFVAPEIYDARPDLFKEIAYFKEPRGGRVISPDTLINYLRFNEEGEVAFSIGDDEKNESDKKEEIPPLKVVDNVEKAMYQVYEDGNLVASISYSTVSFLPTPEYLDALNTKLSRALEEDEPQHIFADDSSGVFETGSRGSTNILSSNRSVASNEGDIMDGPAGFQPPDFGVTMLGSSHGFDGEGTTTGFIVWIYGFGIAVDPPPHSDSYLIMNGVSPRLITHVILTHCHADHDAGTFQKVLTERKIKLLTTKTIYKQFIRKYSAVSGLETSFLTRLLGFEEVKIGEPFYVHGAELNLFYSFHALPCVGFTFKCGGKSLAYSADTYNNKEGLEALVEKGVLSEARKNALLNFPWDCDIVLHECGIPPIHTPVETLMNLPEDIKKNVYAVHIANKAAKAAGLRKAKEGFENTISVAVKPRPQNMAIKVLQLCGATDIFREADISQCSIILEVASHRMFPRGSVFSGKLGGVFFLVAQGILQLKRKKKQPRLLQIGDYFGEISSMNGEVETMSVQALTDVYLIDFNQYAFNQFLRFCPSAHRRLKALEATRSQGFAKSIQRNNVLRHLTFGQRTQLQSLTEKLKVVAEQEALYDLEELLPDKVILVCSGKLQVSNHSNDSEIFMRQQLKNRKKKVRSSSLSLVRGKYVEIGPGSMYIPNNIYNDIVVSTKYIRRSKTLSMTPVKAVMESSVFFISADNMRIFLEDHPGLQLSLMNHPSGVIL